jgi:hypothetical protein
MTDSISDEGLVRLYLSPDPDEATGYAWTAAGGQTLSWYGVSVGSAGDVNGDGYAEAIIGAPEYNDIYTNEGHTYVYFGNGGPGVSLLPRQRTSDELPIARLGRSDRADSLWLRMLAGNPFGRGDLLLEAEVKPLGARFTGSDTRRWGDYMDSSPGAPRLIVPANLHADTAYHWRLRWHYNPATTPYMPASRWLTMPWNGWNEQDLRSGGTTVFLPLVVRNYD